MSADLHARVDNAIARVTASRAAAEVLAEIQTTHRICKPADVTVVALGDLIARAVDATGATGAMRNFQLGSAVVEGLRALGLVIVDADG